MARRHWRWNAAKFLLMLINFLTMVGGLILFSLAIFAMTAQARTTALYSTGLPTGLLIIGLILIVVSVMGFYGTYKEHGTILMTYLGIIVFIFIIQVIMGSLALAYQYEVGPIMYDAWDRAYHEHPADLEHIEHAFQCCGYSSLLDRPYPADCPVNPNLGFTEPCREKLVDAGKSVLRTVGIVTLVVSGIQGLAVFLALLMYWQRPDEFEYHLGRDHSPERISEARTLLREGMNPTYNTQPRNI